MIQGSAHSLFWNGEFVNPRYTKDFQGKPRVLAGVVCKNYQGRSVRMHLKNFLGPGFEILGCSPEKFWGFSELAKSCVAVVTKKCSGFGRNCMCMISAQTSGSSFG